MNREGLLRAVKDAKELLVFQRLSGTPYLLHNKNTDKVIEVTYVTNKYIHGIEFSSVGRYIMEGRRMAKTHSLQNKHPQAIYDIFGRRILFVEKIYPVTLLKTYKQIVIEDTNNEESDEL